MNGAVTDPRATDEVDMNKHYRPAMNQILIIYECNACGAQVELDSCFEPSTCSCGGALLKSGESYPSDAAEWGEELCPDGEWRERWRGE